MRGDVIIPGSSPKAQEPRALMSKVKRRWISQLKQRQQIYPFSSSFFFSFEGWAGRKRNIDWLTFKCAPNGDWTCNLYMCPDRELNQWPFGLWDDAQQTEPQRPGNSCDFLFYSSSQQIGWCPPNLVKVIFFTQSVDSNTNLETHSQIQPEIMF